MKIWHYWIIIFVLGLLMLLVTTIIVCNDILRINLSNFINANVMTWEQAKPILITDYIILPFVSIAAGTLLYGGIKISEEIK